ncbi:MAG: DUF421 domain-containing protein [Fimbriimonas sp.]|nr:DUF421 domain-containing protein [Fimbriimonas sp.]
MNGVWFELSVFAGKTFVVVVYLFLLYRLLGKRQVAQFNLYDLVTVMAVANAVQNAMTTGKGDLAVGIVCASTLLFVGWLVSRLVLRAPKAQHLMFGTPTIIVSDGHILEDRMRRERVSQEELEAALRSHGLVVPTQARLAVLEVDGSISIVPMRSTNETRN